MEHPFGLPGASCFGPGTLSTCVDSGSYTVGVSTLPTKPASSIPTLPGYAASSVSRIGPGQSDENRVVSVGSPENA